MVIFHSYVSLPEGISLKIAVLGLPSDYPMMPELTLHDALNVQAVVRHGFLRHCHFSAVELRTPEHDCSNGDIAPC